jgi:WhiB family redox-sensing transcriptional regulator
MVCRRCPVRVKCLEYAIGTKEPEGIWGGLTPRERKAYTRRKRAS